ncbi:SPOR domain-containing protein [Tropicibacter oceani]|uniref:SPOR domain-containing protein n=1 Tax=Tropicibacter oceani TaxID=3058420 RepID=A0ABY8QD15_9RHOB|nr:SPOR domain-containing protein [Tropicibacter oceani]WGW02323.1 SPOR domain-containing protein [Tropicibacter oceani]
MLRNTVLIFGFFALSACADGQMPGFLQPKSGGGEAEVTRAATGFGTATTERDIEAPEIFQATEAGLWDGRPSLGGVWVAHPDVKEPGRIIIRNEQNGKFVIGALFRRERQSPGPRLQVSSDAAAALGMLAGQPNNLNVVALKREEVAAAPAAMAEPVESEGMMPAAPEVVEGALDPVVSGASAAIETAALAPSKPAAAPAAAPKPAAAAPAPAKPSTLNKPYIQIGIFSVEQNAKDTATAMRQDGMVPTVKKHNSNGKVFWRVIVGPAQSKDELSALLTKIKGTGFTDAYAVTN